ncbi:MAG: hypothetical protein PVG14_14615 [Anaerolineales bacterium]
MSQQSVEKVAAGVDPSWKGLYKVGGISAILYMVLALVVPTLQVLTMEYFEMTAEYGGAEFLKFIAENRLWWLIAQTLLLGGSVLAIVAFVALFVALKHIDKSYAALGAVLAVTSQILFIAYYPVLLGTIYLSDKFVTASADQQVLLGTAADSLMAINNAFNPLYEPLLGVSILFFSLAMLKGVFHKSIAYLGMATCVATFIALSLWPILGVNYFWWWTFFLIWFIAVGWKLYQLGKV